MLALTLVDKQVQLPEVMKMVRSISIVTIIVLYAVLVHHVNTSLSADMLGVLLALLPPFFLIFTIAIKIPSKLLGILLVLAFVLSAYLLLPFIRQHVSFLFWLQDIGLMLILLLTFARTLQPGQKPLCTHLAEMINGGTLPVAHARYARNVTIAWVLFFAAMAIISTLLFFLMPLPIWSIFVNFLTLPLVALMFVAEFMVRRQLLTDLPAGNVFDAVRAYLSDSSRP